MEHGPVVPQIDLFGDGNVANVAVHGREPLLIAQSVVQSCQSGGRDVDRRYSVTELEEFVDQYGRSGAGDDDAGVWRRHAARQRQSGLR